MAKRIEKGSLLLLVALAAVTVGAAQQDPLGGLVNGLLGGQPKPVPVVDGGYTDKIRDAVRGVVVENKRDVAPGLVRLLFHDCFVTGCDGSVLLESTPKNPRGTTEKNAPKNDHLRGMELLQEIRDAIFKAADKKNVSCADAIVFGAREATFLLSNGKIEYPIDGPGRKDGVISSKQDAENTLPGATDNFEKLKRSFLAKDFTVGELVALSATHSVGVCHKPSFVDRLNLALSTPEVHQIDPDYQKVIIEESANANDNVAFKNNLRDMGKPAVDSSRFEEKANEKVDMTAANVLDSSYYSFNLQNMVRFTSDWELRNDTSSSDDNAGTFLESFKVHEAWMTVFMQAMTKLSKLKSNGPFEAKFRQDCTRTNP
ncbi:unnamed protein product [Alopecurus aequalis]